MAFAHENARTASTFMFELQTFLVGLWIVGLKDLQVRGFLHVDFGATCALWRVTFMGGGHPQIVGLHLATASSRPLILGMPPPWILTLHWLQANVMIPILLAQLDMFFYTWHSCWTRLEWKFAWETFYCVQKFLCCLHISKTMSEFFLDVMVNIKTFIWKLHLLGLHN